MKRLLFLTILILIFFLTDALFFNFMNIWIRPHFLLLLVIFVTSYAGIRYGLFVAICAGILKDSMAIEFFGIHIFSYCLCAYATVLIKKYFYELDAGVSRLLTIFAMSLLNGTVACIFISNLKEWDFSEAFLLFIVPEVVATTVLGMFIYSQLRRCVLKLSV